ncbi:MAG: hypothetical protein AB7G87_14200 [Clostridia bacterium]
MDKKTLEDFASLYLGYEFDMNYEYMITTKSINWLTKFDESLYLTGIPQQMEKHGLCKTLLVRNEVINIKHIFTEVFVRKSISLEDGILKKFDISLIEYIEYITNRLRRIHKFSRQYRAPIDEIVKSNRKAFFPTLWLYNGLKNVIVLDFDGVCTANNFRELYELCIARCEVVICSANPTVTEGWFKNREMSIPSEIYACKGKTAKFKKLLEIQKKYDNCFYIDNEAEYLAPAWCIGMKTFIWNSNKIKHFSMHTK